jgi:hypothetical protein
LAVAYGLTFCGKWLKDKVKSLEAGGAVGTLTNAKGLKELAALSGGLKA